MSGIVIDGVYGTDVDGKTVTVHTEVFAVCQNVVISVGPVLEVTDGKTPLVVFGIGYEVFGGEVCIRQVQRILKNDTANRSFVNDGLRVDDFCDAVGKFISVPNGFFIDRASAFVYFNCPVGVCHSRKICGGVNVPTVNDCETETDSRNGFRCVERLHFQGVTVSDCRFGKVKGVGLRCIGYDGGKRVARQLRSALPKFECRFKRRGRVNTACIFGFDNGFEDEAVVVTDAIRDRGEISCVRCGGHFGIRFEIGRECGKTEGSHINGVHRIYDVIGCRIAVIGNRDGIRAGEGGIYCRKINGAIGNSNGKSRCIWTAIEAHEEIVK